MTTDLETKVLPTRAGLSLALMADGRLEASLGRRSAVVTPVRCFPWSAAASFISLRDQEQEEFALVKDLATLDSDSRHALEACLAAAGFVFEIDRIIDVVEEVEIRTWKVSTRQGQRTFQTARDAWPRQLPDGGYLVRDVSGDLYRIPPSEGLDARTRRHLWAFVDE